MPKHTTIARPCPCSGSIHTKRTEASCSLFVARQAREDAARRETAREARLAAQRAYRKTPQYRAYRARWRTDPAGKWVAFQAQARSRRIGVAITVETYAEVVTAVGVYCGTRPEGKLLGIDRLDSGGIYEDGNIVACCATCNFMKGTLSVAEFLAKIREVAARCPTPASVVAVGDREVRPEDAGVVVVVVADVVASEPDSGAAVAGCGDWD
jgi:hypothetical protein